MGYGGVAQLGEHLLCKQGVTGSIPVVSIDAGARLGAQRRSGCAASIPWSIPGQSSGGLLVTEKKRVRCRWPSLLAEGGLRRRWRRACEGWRVCSFGNCESGSGASLGVPRRATDRMGLSPWLGMDCPVPR